MTEQMVDLPPYAPAPGGPPTRRGPGAGVVAALVVGVVGLLAAGVFAVSLVGSGGGSSSPEDAVRAMLAAAASEDAIGVMEALAPGERDALLQPLTDLAGELERLGILEDGFDLRRIGGLDLEFDDVELSTEPLADGIAVVHVVSGTARTRTVPGEIPLGPVLRDIAGELGGDLEVEPAESVEDLSNAEAVIATVKVDGDWYVSLFYSIAEAARRDAGEPLPPFGRGVPAEGASTPEGAVEALARAMVDLDVRRMVSLTPPDEMAALHDYAPLFLDDAEQAVAELRRFADFEVRIDRLDLESDVSGDTARVRARAFAVSGLLEGEAFSVEYDGECTRYEVPDLGAGEQCAGDVPETDMAFPVPEGLADLDLTVTAVQVDGAWYVSPTRTTLGMLVDVLRGLERHDLEQLAGFFASLAFGGFGFDGAPFGDLGGFEMEGIDGQPFGLGGPGGVVGPDAQFECFAILAEAQPRTEEEFRAAEVEVESCLQRAALGD